MLPKIKNADPGVPAEAAFYLGEHEYHKMEPIVLKGKEKEKAKTIKQLVDILQKAMSQYSKSATYASERWTFKATNKMGMLFVTMAAKIREEGRRTLRRTYYRRAAAAELLRTGTSDLPEEHRPCS